MKKYYFNDGRAQQGPFTLEELQAKNITAETPVWYDGLPDWTTAGQVEELKEIFIHTPPPFHAAAATTLDEVKPVVTATPVTAVAEASVASVTAPATTAPAKPAKKSTAWLSYVLALLVLGGVGYFIYQDMEKNKGNNKNSAATMTPATDSTANTESHQIVVDPTNETPQPEAAKEEAVTTTETTAPTTTATTATAENNPPVATTAKTQKATLTPATAKPGTTSKTQQAEAQKLAQKKAEEENKKFQAAQAAAALKEKEYRNNWPKYITFGKLDYKTKDDGVEAFNVPVYNGTNAMLDKVTVRVDYMKKEKKVVKSETIVIYNIPPGAGLNGKAPGNKKGNNIKLFITGITSRKLHFCYPANNGNPADPYFCN